MTNRPMGLIRGMPSAQYHADEDSVSNGMLSAMADSPAHCFGLYLAPNRPARVATDAMTLGTLAHAFILEPGAIEQRYAIKPRGMNFATKEGKAWRDAQTLEIVSQADADAAGAMVAAVKRDPDLAELLSSGDGEASAFGICKSTGLRMRARPDWLHWTGKNRCKVLDIKTINELTADTVKRAIGAYSYHRQAAHYTNVLNACGIEVEAFVFGFVSSTYPYLSVPYVLDEESVDQAFDEVAELMEKFAACKAANRWPVSGGGYQLTGLPDYKRRSREIEVGYAE
jgi:hypothetical protein